MVPPVVAIIHQRHASRAHHHLVNFDIPGPIPEIGVSREESSITAEPGLTAGQHSPSGA
jgi:hypothetical protein